MHPNAFCDMPKAVERIVKAINDKDKEIDHLKNELLSQRNQEQLICICHQQVMM